VQARIIDRLATGRVEETRTNALEPMCLAGTHHTQVIILECPGLFQHAGIPYDQHFLACVRKAWIWASACCQSSQQSAWRSRVMSAADCSGAWYRRAPAQALVDRHQVQKVVSRRRGCAIGRSGSGRLGRWRQAGSRVGDRACRAAEHGNRQVGLGQCIEAHPQLIVCGVPYLDSVNGF
jgi:hypothetical protein